MAGKISISSINSKQFNIYVVEDHNEALEKIYNEIGSKRLNFKNLIMVHFDSHPDLGIRNNLDADLVFNKHELFDSISIESWILPAVYAGHLSHVIWIKPNWSDQFKAGLYKIQVGKDKKTGFLKCDCRETYFLSDNMYSNENNLLNKKTLELYVCNFDTIIDQFDPYLEKQFKFLSKEEKNFIFDLDLDFFSTQDPFKDMFKSIEEFDLFKLVYKFNFECEPTDSEFDQKYELYNFEKENKMKNIYLNLNTDGFLEDLGNLSRLKSIIKKNNLDLEILHSYGSGLDDKGLPHHVSTESELETMLHKFELFINRYLTDLAVKPSVVTIARSSLDEYCPIGQVDLIQSDVLKIFKNVFNKDLKSIKFNY